MGQVPKVRNFSKSSLNCLSETIYFESRGQGELGMLAVGFVVINRSLHKAYPSDICKVVHQPGQFSWVGSSMKISERAQWELSKKIVWKIVSGQIPDPTKGSTNFHRYDLGVDWSGDRLKKTVVIGHHQFYRLH